MKLLLVGNGGREHALADALSRENTAIELLACPGNPGIEQLARTIPISASSSDAIVSAAKEENVDLVIVGPEAPLADGLVDRLTLAGIAAFGPTQAAAEIETSKHVAKSLMTKAGVATARSETHVTALAAHQAVSERFGSPVVIKASGLAAGKGVVVCNTEAEAHEAIDHILSDRVFGSAGEECLVEEFMAGEELSLFAITDGKNVLTMLPAQDHKRLLDGDLGPNTGGMGAYTPVKIGTDILVDGVTETILLPTLHALQKRGTPFKGLLYAGLMLTAEGPKVVEFNCRFGDPETQAILPMLESSLLDPLLTVAKGGSFASHEPLKWKQGASVTTVVAASGYPAGPRTGDVISLPDSSSSLRVFHAGTKRNAQGELVTSGGRVVAITGIANGFAEAAEISRNGAAKVHFEGSQYRSDIGWREHARISQS